MPCGLARSAVGPRQPLTSYLSCLLCCYRAYDDEDEESKNDKASQGKSAPTGAAFGGGQEQEEHKAEGDDDTDTRPRKRTIRWLDETSGEIESYDCKRQKAVEAGREAQVLHHHPPPCISWHPLLVVWLPPSLSVMFLP